MVALGHYLEWARLVDARLGNIAPAQVEDHAQAMEERGYSIHFHVWDRSSSPRCLSGPAGPTTCPCSWSS